MGERRRVEMMMIWRRLVTEHAVSTVLPETDTATILCPSNANSGHGQASAAGHSSFAATFRPSRPPHSSPPTLDRMIHSIRPFFPVALGQRKLALERLHFGFRVFAVTENDNG